MLPGYTRLIYKHNATVITFCRLFANASATMINVMRRLRLSFPLWSEIADVLRWLQTVLVYYILSYEPVKYNLPIVIITLILVYTHAQRVSYFTENSRVHHEHEFFEVQLLLVVLPTLLLRCVCAPTRVKLGPGDDGCFHTPWTVISGTNLFNSGNTCPAPFGGLL